MMGFPVALHDVAGLAPHCAVVDPWTQLHIHRPLVCVTLEAVPLPLQRLVGVDVINWPLSLPQVATVGPCVAAQLVVVAFAPDPAAQLHVQPPLVAVTVAARLPPPHKSVGALGAWVMVLPFAAPQAAAG